MVHDIYNCAALRVGWVVVVGVGVVDVHACKAASHVWHSGGRGLQGLVGQAFRAASHG